MILADTNVVSEFMRPEPDPAVWRWAQGIAPSDLSISVLTIQEIELGILRLPPSERRERLSAAWAELRNDFASAVVAYDGDAASATASLLADSAAMGVTMSLADAQIAGTCLSRGAALATRNTRDFKHLPRLAVINPFTDEA